MISAFGAGLVFGIGLWLCGMANPRKGARFPRRRRQLGSSLLVVMGGAFAVTATAFGRC